MKISLILFFGLHHSGIKCLMGLSLFVFSLSPTNIPKALNSKTREEEKGQKICPHRKKILTFFLSFSILSWRIFEYEKDLRRILEANPLRIEKR